MKGLSKIMSVLLIASACFGVYGGVVNLQDVSSCKDYWEEKGEKANEDLDKLSDGIDQLGENEQAYTDGVTAVADGEEELAAGKSELDAGRAKLAAGEKELAAGKAKVASGEKELAVAKAKLDAGQAAYNKGYADYESGLAKLQAAEDNYGGPGVPNLAEIYNGVEDVKAGAQITNTDTAIEYFAKNYVEEDINDAYQGVNNAIDTFDAIAENVDTLKPLVKKLANEASAKYGEYKKAGLEDSEALNAAISEVADAYKAEGATPGLVGASFYGVTNSKEKTEDAKVLATTYGIVASEVKKEPETIEYMYTTVQEGKDATEAAAVRLVATRAQESEKTIQGIYDGVELAKSTGLTEEEAISYVAKRQVSAAYNGYVDYNKGKAAAEAGKTELDAAAAELSTGRIAYSVGQKTLAAGKADVAAGEKELSSGYAELADGEAKLADGEKELEAGKAKLKEYEDGEAQLIDGLNTLLASETYGDLKSIKARLGDNFNFMKDNGKNVDLAKAEKAEKAGRDFLADTEVAVTDELTPRAYGDIAILIASLFALIGGVLGLTKRRKAAGVSGIIAAVAAGIGAYFISTAGTTMSEVAGSTASSPMVAMIILAAVGVIAAIANFMTKADA